MTRKDELETTIQEAREELGEIKYREMLEEHVPLVGKCYKCRNCYSCPGPDDHWWLYLKITGLDSYRFTVFSFEKDNAGKITIDPESNWGGIDYQEITRAEFTEAWNQLRAEIARL